MKKLLPLLLFSFLLAGCSNPQDQTIPTWDVMISWGAFQYNSQDLWISFSVPFPTDYQGSWAISTSGTTISVFGQTLTLYTKQFGRSLIKNVTKMIPSQGDCSLSGTTLSGSTLVSFLSTCSGNNAQIILGDQKHTTFAILDLKNNNNITDEAGNPWYHSITFVK